MKQSQNSIEIAKEIAKLDLDIGALKRSKRLVKTKEIDRVLEEKKLLREKLNNELFFNEIPLWDRLENYIDTYCLNRKLCKEEQSDLMNYIIDLFGRSNPIVSKPKQKGLAKWLSIGDKYILYYNKEDNKTWATLEININEEYKTN